VMHRQAARRNRRWIAAGRVELHVASAERLPFADASFERALTLHSIAHWADPGRGLAELRRVLAPGGLLLVGLRGDAVAAATRTEAAIAGAGLRLTAASLSGAPDRRCSSRCADDQRPHGADAPEHRRPEIAVLLGEHPHRHAIRHREQHVRDCVRRRVEPQDALALLGFEQARHVLARAAQELGELGRDLVGAPRAHELRVAGVHADLAVAPTSASSRSFVPK
jgi:SAM-dependent methyltransferase